MRNPAVAVKEAVARPTADTVQITFRLPTKWLEQADAVAAYLARAGRPMGRTDGFRALIAAGLFHYSPEIAKLADLVALDLAMANPGGVGFTREDAIKAALQKYVDAAPLLQKPKKR